MTFHRFLTPCCIFAFGLHTLVAQEGAEPPKQPASNPAGMKAAAELMEAAKSRIKKTGDTDYALGDITFSSATREVRVPAVVNMTEGVLEYVLVHETGKTHESLLRTTVKPTELNVALLLCRYEPHIREAAQFLTDPKPETKAKMALPMEHEGANRLGLTLEWKDKDGTAHRTALSDWLQDHDTGKPMQPGHWTYTGSLITSDGFAAEHEGSHIAIYFDLVSMINFPDKGNADDDRWFVAKAAIPPLDTPVTVVISPLPPAAAAPVSK